MMGPASLWAGFLCHLRAAKALLAERMRNSPRLMMAFTLGCRFILLVILVAMPAWTPEPFKPKQLKQADARPSPSRVRLDKSSLGVGHATANLQF